MYNSTKRNFVGVVSPAVFSELGYPKQLLLMFDKLAIDLSNPTDKENIIIQRARSEFDWLSDQQLLTTLSNIVQENIPDLDKENIEVSGEFLLPGGMDQELRRYAKSFLRPIKGLKGLREIANDLRLMENIDAVAIGVPATNLSLDEVASRDTVVRLTLNNFPIPKDSTSWENILDFKKDKDSTEKFYRLKNWMNAISKKEMKVYEVEDELNDILGAYENHMKYHDMRTTYSAVDVLVNIPLEFAQNLIRLKFSDAFKAIVKIKQEKIKLLSEERKAIGSEVAYIINAQRKFG